MKYDKFCKCGRLLTIKQMRDNQPCDKCQRFHAQGFKDRFEKLQKEDKDDKNTDLD